MDIAVQKKIESFFNTYSKRTYKKGEVLIRASEVPSRIYYLTKGSVRKYAISPKGDELVVNIFRPISFFPISHAINDISNDFFYEALEEVSVREASTAEVVIFIKKNPDVLFDLLQRVLLGTEGMTKRLTYLLAGNAYARLVTELVIQTKRFGSSENGGFILRISESDLAASSGMTRETVSREMKKLKEKEILFVQKKAIYIRNLHLLEAELLKLS